MNADWHKRHTMAKRATAEERLDWHLDHQDHCNCRTIPKGLRPLLLRRIEDFEQSGKKTLAARGRRLRKHLESAW